MNVAASLALAACLFGVAPSILHAQYRRSSGDTLRFREVTHTTITLQGPLGSVPLSALHDATLALTFGSGDTATAWYETLTLADQTPLGEVRPETTPALGQPFVLHFDARGRVVTLRAPHFPDSFEKVSDLTKQFADYFLTLPADFDLSQGRAWSDTVVQVDSGPAGGITNTRRVIECRVVGDTAVAGQPARVVAMRQHVAVTSAGPVPGQALTARNELSGEDSGIFVFSPALGRMLGRSRTGQLTGTVTYEGGTRPFVVRERYSYTNTIDPVP